MDFGFDCGYFDGLFLAMSIRNMRYIAEEVKRLHNWLRDHDDVTRYYRAKKVTLETMIDYLEVD